MQNGTYWANQVNVKNKVNNELEFIAPNFIKNTTIIAHNFIKYLVIIALNNKKHYLCAQKKILFIR